jgi:hypothetical protein
MLLEDEMQRFNIAITYEWQAVLLRENVKYLYPLAITPFMRSRYREPGIFRWNIYGKIDADKKFYYIGEAQEICPRRLYGYLNPGPTQQSNKKIKVEFEAYLKAGLNIGLDICSLKELKFDALSLGKEALVDKYNRRLIVAAMIVEHRKQGLMVLDL